MTTVRTHGAPRTIFADHIVHPCGSESSSFTLPWHRSSCAVWCRRTNGTYHTPGIHGVPRRALLKRRSILKSHKMVS